MRARSTFTDEIDRFATRSALDLDLVEAVVLQESNGNPWAMRFEPHYRWLWDVRAKKPYRVLSDEMLASPIAPPDFPSDASSDETEWIAQRLSIGLMQIMGAVARERGFPSERSLLELCDPETNLDKGTDYLAYLMRRAGGDIALGLGAYNAGFGGARSEAGKKYAEKVLAIRSQLEPRT